MAFSFFSSMIFPLRLGFSSQMVIGCSHGGREESAGRWCVYGSKELLCL